MPRSKPDMRIIGAAGTDISSGVIQRPSMPSQSLGQDYNTRFTLDQIDKMVYGDGQVFAVWNAITLAIQQADWDMVPFSDSKKDKDIARFLEDMITPLWPEILQQALNYLLYGFMLFEPIYAVDDGKIVWKSLSPRLPWTISEWIPGDGYVKEVVQYAWDYKTGQYGTFRIPGTKLIRFTNRQNGYNFEGQSILRGAFKHWDHKDVLYKIMIIRHERYGVGVPIGALDENATDEQVDKFEETLMNMRSNEVGYIMLPRGTDIDKAVKILVPDGGDAGSNDLIEAVEHHNVQIARSVLTQFINLGDTKTGARAVAEDMSSLFLMSLGFVVKYIGHIITYGQPGENRGLSYLVDANFGKVDGYPVWKCEKIKKDNSSALLATIAQLVQSGALIHDESLERHNRRMIGIPMEDIVPAAPLSNGMPAVKPDIPGQQQPIDQAPEPAIQGVSTNLADITGHSCGHDVHLSDPPREMDKLPHEEFVDFSSIEAFLDSASSDMVAVWRNILRKQLDAIGSFVGPKIVREELNDLININMPFVDELAEAFQDIMARSFSEGRKSAKRELIKQAIGAELQDDIDEEEDEDEQKWLLLIAAARAAAEALSMIVYRSLVDSTTTNIASSGEASWDDVARRAWSISDEHVIKETSSINWAYGFGRQSTANEYAAFIREGFYSAILDQNTCPTCIAMHGRSNLEIPFITPNPDCQGNLYSNSGNPCRCITIWILKPGVSVSDLS